MNANLDRERQGEKRRGLLWLWDTPMDLARELGDMGKPWKVVFSRSLPVVSRVRGKRHAPRSPSGTAQRWKGYISLATLQHRLSLSEVQALYR